MIYLIKIHYLCIKIFPVKSLNFLHLVGIILIYIFIDGIISNEYRRVKTSIILVDHTILIEELNYLKDYVIGIYDHHLLSNYNDQYKNLQTVNIVYPVGSCTTLILQEYFNDMDEFPVKVISPILAVNRYKKIKRWPLLEQMKRLG